MSPRSRTSPSSTVPTGSPTRRIAAVAVALAAVVLLVIAIAQIVSSTSTEPEPDSEPSAATGQYANNDMYRDLATLARRDPADPMALGSPTAPVVMIEYSDLQCPYCRQFAQTTEPELVAKYVDRGLLRIEWRNLAFFGEESERAARAGWAAGQQGRFWELHELMFENAPAKKNTGVFTADRLTEWAGLAGVGDLDRFRADLDSDAARAAVTADITEAVGIGVNSTPAFLINGRPILGARPVEQMIAVIEAGLLDEAPGGGQ
ncbi:DsbA family protein [Rhodococcus sp. NPDC058505]|uniref:DsbA family protein n=1 Tax=Rhodococcus sp. NPDC058505 TaxID=3346531 RepID=UPI00365D847F